MSTHSFTKYNTPRPAGIY